MNVSAAKELDVGPEYATPTLDACKLCGSEARLRFGLPKNKLTGLPIPDEPDDCWYYECSVCRFLYTRSLDDADHTELYDDLYWSTQDPDWYGRVSETLRLVAFSNELIRGHMPKLDVLDFGCGMGTFVEMSRTSLGLKVWGTDISPPKHGRDWYLEDLGDRKFDVIVACEVIEHLADPVATFRFLMSHLKSPGVIAFQTAYWDGGILDRDWWYLGPKNGHISLFSPESFTYLFGALRGRKRKLWDGYPGLQAWLFP